MGRSSTCRETALAVAQTEGTGLDGHVLAGVLAEVADAVAPEFGKGKTASYIPALRRVNRRSFAFSVALPDGSLVSHGLHREPFSTQSITKLFSLELAMRIHGDEVWRHVGKEPSGTRFNSMVLLEHEKGLPRNPFINAGAMAVVDLLMGGGRPAPHLLVRDYLAALTQNHAIAIDAAVYESERRASDRNAAIAHFLKAHGRLRNDPQQVLDEYCRICAIEMTTEDLARATLPLACGGFSPQLGEQVLTGRQARRINALMITSGMYDAVGSFACRVGLPAKSGVGGGIVAVAPGRCALAVWSPELDLSGNSLVGTAALEYFVKYTGLSIL